MKVLYGHERLRASILLKDGLTPDEIAVRLLVSRSFSLWAAIKMDVEEVLGNTQEPEKEPVGWRSIWEVLQET